MLPISRNLFNGSLVQTFRLLKHKRCVSTQRACEEIRIPGPWGNVAGKWWGPQDKRPILALHGWQDNCGTFDTLIPFLPPNIGVLALDIPGHGLSAPLPPGVFYHGIDISIFIRKVAQYFGWSKVSLMGHSMGAMNSFVYSMLYPETIDFLICIDSLYAVPVEKHAKPDGMAKTIDNFIKYDALNNNQKEPPSYTFAELEQLLHKGSKKSISLEACKYLLQRNIVPTESNPDQFHFRRDIRLKVPILLQWNNDAIIEGCQRISCPVFLCIGKKSFFYNCEKDFLKVIEVIRKQNHNVEYHLVEGTHHLHLNTPEVIEGLINAFIQKYDLADRSDGGCKKEIRMVSS